MDKDVNEIKDKIVEWLKEKLKESGAGGAVIGLSGGLDSSVVAVLAKTALGGDVLGVIMPCQSNDEDTEHARMLARKFDIKTEFVDLKPVFNKLKRILPPGARLADANLKPRLRMLTLYYFANLHNYIVLGTGNKTEIMIGYATKHGDAGCDLLPLGSLYKSRVRELAGILGVPDEIISKPPSAGLWHGQTDEGEIGMSYDELDATLMAIEKNETAGIDSSKLIKVKAMIKKSLHKRQMPEMFKP